jgi:hypothetical protein|nr:MAG TPA: hypothetical protein [Caudoviricetes sp.]
MKKKQFVHRLASSVENLAYGFQLNFKGMEKLSLIKEFKGNEGFFLDIGYSSFLKTGHFSQHFTTFENLKYQEKEGLFFSDSRQPLSFLFSFFNLKEQLEKNDKMDYYRVSFNFYFIGSVQSNELYSVFSKYTMKNSNWGIQKTHGGFKVWNELYEIRREDDKTGEFIKTNKGISTLTIDVVKK